MRDAWMRARHTLMTTGMAIALIGCQVPVATPQAPAPAAVPAFSLEAVSLIDALADKAGRNWHDGLLNFPPLLEKLKHKTYKTQAVSNGAIAWSKATFGAVTSAPALLRTDPAANNTLGGDAVFVINDAGTVYKVDPTSGNTLLSASVAGTFSKTAVVISGDNQRLYLLTKDGKLKIVRTSDLVVTNTITLNASATAFTGLCPFLDYGNNNTGGNTNFGSKEVLYAVAQDGTTYRVDVDATGAAPTTAMYSYATALAGATVVASPVCWKNKIYWGSTAGDFYEVNYNSTAAPSRRQWDLGANTTATGNGAAINAPAALDYDAALNVTDIFVGCGDRVNWINAATGDVAPSSSLTLDRIPPAGNANKLSAYVSSAPSVVAANNAADWVAIKSAAAPAPTRWGGGAAFSNVSAVVASATSVRVHPTTGEIWVTDQANAKVTRLNSAGVAQGTMALGSAGNGPIKCEFDGGGNCWVSAGAIPGGGTVAKYTSAGAVVWSKAITGALYVAPERTGAGPYGCWVVDYNGGKISKLDSAGNYSFGPVALAGITTIYTDSANNCWTTGFINNNQSYKYTPAGARSGPFGTGTNPIFIAFDPANQNPWITNNNQGGGNPNTSGSITKLVNATGALSSTQANLGDHPWSVRFDPSGVPWLTHMDYFGSAPRTLERITKATGAQEALFSFVGIGNPFEMDFEADGTTWVACTPGGLYKIYDVGNTQDLFASSYRLIAAPPDGDDSYAFVKYKIAINAFANQAVTGSYLKLTAATTPPGTDDIEVYPASSNNPSTATPWVGYSGAPNVDYNNRPVVTTPYVEQKTGVQYTKDTAYNFNVPAPADQKNSTDAANALWTFAVKTTNKPLRNAVHWYSQTSAGGTTAKYPSLNVTLAGGAKLPTTNGISCQPTIDSRNKHVWVVACNALFELNFNSVDLWGDPANTTYNLTAQGRLAAPSPIYTAPAPKTYIFPAGNALLNFRDHVVVPDYNPANGDMWLNNFDVSTLGNVADHLYYQVDVGAGTGGTTALQQMLFDYDGGGVYMVTTNNTIIKATINQ
ncbi:MAG: hypothetical protein JWM80_1846 [Cyanobacteria bacterium RYN_339]|nr:hypothetical protein [Cyanobacteria bacterium RYN_339]